MSDEAKKALMELTEWQHIGPDYRNRAVECFLRNFDVTPKERGQAPSDPLAELISNFMHALSVKPFHVDLATVIREKFDVTTKDIYVHISKQLLMTNYPDLLEKALKMCVYPIDSSSNKIARLKRELVGANEKLSKIKDT